MISCLDFIFYYVTRTFKQFGLLNDVNITPEINKHLLRMLQHFNVLHFCRYKSFKS
jgi:hypothetical protein